MSYLKRWVRNPRFSRYLVGSIIHSSVMILFQDALGLERFITYLRSHWVSWVYSTPIAIVSLVIAVVAIRLDYLDFKEEPTEEPSKGKDLSH